MPSGLCYTLGSKEIILCISQLLTHLVSPKNEAQISQTKDPKYVNYLWPFQSTYCHVKNEARSVHLWCQLRVENEGGLLKSIK